MNITSRQRQIILSVLTGNNTLAKLTDLTTFYEVTERTLQRDLSELHKLKLLSRHGEGRSVTYGVTDDGKFDLYCPKEILEGVFSDEARSPVLYDFDRPAQLKNRSLFSAEERAELGTYNRIFKQKLKTAPADIIRRERERITIELSWKSSQMEGNTYTLLETESLLKDGVVAKGKSDFETRMVINHKNALDFSAEHRDMFKDNITPQAIIDLHKILVEGLDISYKLREQSVSITGSVFKPLNNGYQIKEELKKFCDIVNSKTNVYEKSLLAFVFICYLQPFNDGNKRTGRILANAILYAYDSFPLSLRAVQVDVYKLAILAFYEFGILGNVKKVYVDQARYSAENYAI